MHSFGNSRLDPLSAIALIATTTSAGATAGTSVTYPVATTTTGFFADPVAFGCTDLPVGATCTIDPGLPDGSGSATVNVTVTSTAPKTAWNLPTSSSSPVSMGGLFLLPFVIPLGRRKSRLRMPLFFLAIASLGTTTACGGDDDATSTPPTLDAGKKAFDAGVTDTSATPPGSYAFKVVASSGVAKATADLTLIVQ